MTRVPSDNHENNVDQVLRAMGAPSKWDGTREQRQASLTNGCISRGMRSLNTQNAYARGNGTHSYVRGQAWVREGLRERVNLTLRLYTCACVKVRMPTTFGAARLQAHTRHVMASIRRVARSEWNVQATWWRRKGKERL